MANLTVKQLTASIKITGRVGNKVTIHVPYAVATREQARKAASAARRYMETVCGSDLTSEFGAPEGWLAYSFTAVA